MKPEVRHAFRLAAMLNGPMRGVKTVDLYGEIDVYPSFSILAAKYAKESRQVWCIYNKHTSEKNKEHFKNNVKKNNGIAGK